MELDQLAQVASSFLKGISIDCNHSCSDQSGNYFGSDVHIKVQDNLYLKLYLVKKVLPVRDRYNLSEK